MGIDFSHCDAHWAYGGFMRFRERLAEAEGFDLRRMVGFAGSHVDLSPMAPARPWDTVSTPLRPMLDHSDCDGELTPAECAQVEPRLREIAESWDEGDYDRQAALEFCAGMRAAIATDEPLEFM